MRYLVVHPSEWLYPDIFEYTSASDKIAAHAPRGGYAAVQIMIPETSAGLPIRVEACGIALPECYRLLDVRVTHNVSWEGGIVREGDGVDPTPWVTRRAPFRVYDVLQPLSEGGNITEGNVTALYLCWPIDREDTPGLRTGMVKLTIGEEMVEIPVEITVHAVQLPQKSRLSMTNWFTTGNISRPYGLIPETPEWYAMYKKLMCTMQRTRQTHLLISLKAIKIAETAPGVYDFDFTDMRRMIEMAIDAGFQTLELGHIGVRNYDAHENIWLFYQPEGRKIYATSEESYRFLAQFLPRWRAFLEENGWYDMAVHHVSDEPTRETEADYRFLSATLRKFLPGMPLFDAIVFPQLRGASDYWIPYNSIYQQQRDKWEELRALGDEIWCYTCCNPGGKWLNRLLDMELLRPRLMHWGNYKYNLTGYLHWGFNYWHMPENLNCEEAMAYLRENSIVLEEDGTPHGWPAGDSHICYPGNHNGPWMSIRAEAMRMGAEDCELLYIVADQDPEKANALCSEVFTAFNEYSTDPKAFAANAILLLEAADRAQKR